MRNSTLILAIVTATAVAVTACGQSKQSPSVEQSNVQGLAGSEYFASTYEVTSTATNADSQVLKARREITRSDGSRIIVQALVNLPLGCGSLDGATAIDLSSVSFGTFNALYAPISDGSMSSASDDNQQTSLSSFMALYNSMDPLQTNGLPYGVGTLCGDVVAEFEGGTGHTVRVMTSNGEVTVDNAEVRTRITRVLWNGTPPSAPCTSDGTSPQSQSLRIKGFIGGEDLGCEWHYVGWGSYNCNVGTVCLRTSFECPLSHSQAIRLGLATRSQTDASVSATGRRDITGTVGTSNGHRASVEYNASTQAAYVSYIGTCNYIRGMIFDQCRCRANGQELVRTRDLCNSLQQGGGVAN